eukprot:TRINITY_DN1371_c0_g2_i4.p1 TRINITY_DN1371_c0_g2~~TRINITY_DN1371_c0_g2_i4.p1  ORF type:complete len:180 (+),score=32.80 TRINITY_DN1371_c0_g2_i4:157-696(+)
MKKVFLISLLFVCLASAKNFLELPEADNAVPFSQIFIKGELKGMNLDGNDQVTGLINEAMLNSELILMGLSLLSSFDKTDRTGGCYTTAKIYEGLALALGDILKQDADLAYLIQCTIELFSDPDQFEAHSDAYQKRSGTSIIKKFKYAYNLAVNGGFYTAGQTFGQAVDLLLKSSKEES